MALKIYNTLTKNKEEFIPLVDKRVGIYTCGITAYDYSHIGHARSAVVFDTVVRYLRYRGYTVRFVRNFTDVDDKIIRRSREENIPINELSQSFIQAYRQDMSALGTVTPDDEPLATDYICEMIELIERLIEKGLAYQVENDVFYSVENFAGYGKLSHRDTEELMAGSRIDIDARKHNPLDFALWKSAKPGEPWWNSPWGKGRPGWHIECSAMATRILGPTLDIHGGGKDLIFPHHENEIAQAEGSSGKPFVRYWMHNGFVNMNQEKMSKSLGNVLNIREILKAYHPEVIRFFLLSKHYRSPLDYSPEIMKEMKNALERVYQTLDRLDQKIDKGVTPNYDHAGALYRDVLDKTGHLLKRMNESMDDDFNTAKAIGFIFPLLRSVNRILDELPGNNPAPDCLAKARETVNEFGRVMGLFQAKPEDFLTFNTHRVLDDSDMDQSKVERLVRERTEARKNKNWNRADEIRDQLAKHNVVLEDRPEGTIWRIV